jgi:hypothetical protein
MQDGTAAALRQEGHVSQSRRDALYKHGPPSGGRARLVTGSINMALLTEDWNWTVSAYRNRITVVQVISAGLGLPV